MCHVYVTECFNNKNVYKYAKHTDSPVKKKFRMQLSVKKVMLINFRGMGGHRNIDLFAKGAIVINISYCQLFKAIFTLI